jgi:hypothetical protein
MAKFRYRLAPFVALDLSKKKLGLGGDSCNAKY